MRLLRLVDDDSFVVEFHPYITVVTDLDDLRREAVVEAFQQAAIGRTAGLRGLMEVHGVVLDLDERSLGLLELGTDAVETCVRPSDLPGSVSGGVGRQVRAAERRLETLEQPRRDRVEALAAAEVELEQAIATERSARAAVAALAEAAEAAASRVEEEDDVEERIDVDDEAADHEALDERRAELTSRRASIDAERSALAEAQDPGAGQALDEAVAALEEARASFDRASEAAEAAAATPEPDVDDGGDPAEDPMAHPLSEAETEDRLADLRSALALHRIEDPSPIRDALDEVRLGHNTGERMPSTDALSLADRIESLAREIDATSDESTPQVVDVESAAEDLERARTTLAEIERRSSDSGSAADVEALEAAHAEVERARDGIGGRLGRARAQDRLDAAVAAEDELLDRLGLTSYTEFLTLGGATSRPDDRSGELAIARRSVEQAEAVALDYERRVDVALARAELVATRRALLDEARALLGDDGLADDQVTAALIEYRVDASTSVQIDQLVDLLETVGLPVRGLDLEDAEIEEMASEWLADRQHAEARILRRIDELESAVPPIGDAEPDLVMEEPAVADETPDDDGAAEAAVNEARDEVDAAERVVRAAKDLVMGHERASAQIAALDEEATAVDEEIATHDAAREADEAARAAAADVEDEDAPGDGDGDGDGDAGGDAEADIALAEATAAVDAAVAGVDAARATVTSAQEDVDESQGDYSAAVEELAVLRQTVAELDDVPPPVEEVEWYLLARLAGQRQQSFVGSLPLVVIGALDAVDDDEGLDHLLDRLERMAGAVQIVHLTDDPRVVAWAHALPDDRAAVVRPAARVV